MSASSSAQIHSCFMGEREQLPLRAPEYPPAMTTARRIVTDFLRARVAANNARLTFILDQTPENLTAWVDADAALDGIHHAEYHPAEPFQEYADAVNP